jgi:hypothetical protein
VTFRVRDLKQLAKDGIVVTGGVITTADGILINVVEDTSVDGAARFDSMTIATIAPADAQAGTSNSSGRRPGRARP